MKRLKGSDIRLLLWVLPILLWTISLGCTTTTPPLREDAVCKHGNDVQKESWQRVVAMARLPDDPHRIAPGVLWAGGHLWRCR